MRRSLCCAVFFCLVLTGTLPADAQTADTVQSTTTAAQLTPAGVFSAVKDAVVTIRTPTGQGSGVIVSAAGVVVTNLHVVSDDKSATVTLPNGDSHDVISVVGIDQRRDLALLRIAGFELRTAALGNSDSVNVGDRVMAIGSPSGLELSLSEGIVSAVRDTGEGYRVIQTTAPISSGSSGGGLFDAAGQLVGITSFKIRGAENLNFAIPVNYVRGLMGVRENPMTLAEVANRFGTQAPQQDRTAAPSTSTLPAKAPLLEATYRHPMGPRILIKQRDTTATITFYRADNSVYGNGSVTWDLNVMGFVGFAEIPYVCGTIDTRVTTVRSGLELYPEREGTLRMRYQVPSGINCDRNRIDRFDWGEDRWYP